MATSFKDSLVVDEEERVEAGYEDFLIFVDEMASEELMFNEDEDLCVIY